MNWLRCAIKQAFRGIRSGPIIQLASIGTIAAGLLLLGSAMLAITNLEQLTQRWGRGIQIILYFKADAPLAKRQALARILQSRPEVLSAKEVTSNEAYHRLAESLGNRSPLLSGVEKDFLPTSLEISLSQNRTDHARPLLALLRSSPLVEEVDYLGTWVERLNSIVNLLRAAGWVTALLVSLASLYIINSTIRLGVFARREEIEILKLVGATDRFIRAPFMVEGAIQGLLGSFIAMGVLYFIFRLVSPRVENVLTMALSHMQLSFLPYSHLFLGILTGTVLGLLGSRLALGRYLEV